MKVLLATDASAPSEARPSRAWHLGKLLFNKAYWHTVPRGRL